MRAYLYVLAMLVSLPAGAGTASAQAEEPGVPVTLVSVQRGAIQRTSHVQALAESVNAPKINSKVSAEVLEIHVDEGDRVRQGDLLARLDDEAFRLDKEAAEADIARLEATLANQLLTLKRDEQLFRKKLVPDTRLDDSRTAVKLTRASIVHAKVLLKKAEYQLSHATVRAPVDGVVQQRLVSVGDYLNPNSPSSKPLFQLVDIKHLRARLFFSDRLAGIVRIGMPATLRRGDQAIAARITQVLPMIEDGSRSFLALAEFDNRYDWAPGTRISADVVLDRHQDALLIPEAALVQRPGGVRVYRVREDRAEELAPVTGISHAGRVEVLSGLSEGDRLVLDGAAYLSNGVKVSVGADTAEAGTTGSGQ